MLFDLAEHKNSRIQELVNLLNDASNNYYNGSPIMSDHEYDRLFDELLELEHTTGIVLENSPTHRVGYSVNSESQNKIAHEYPARSLDKTKDLNKLISTFDVFHDHRDEVDVMWKLDGATLQLTYEGGHIVLAATRGDGYIGQNVTRHAKYIKGIPQTISEKSKVVVRGEVIIKYEDFEKLNQESSNLLYKNPRNLASGSLSLLDTQEVRNRKLQFYGFELVCHPNKDNLTFFNRLTTLSFLGFQVVPHSLCRVHKDSENVLPYLEDVVDLYTKNSTDFQIPVDGLVLAYNDTKYTDRLEGTEHHPNILSGYAYKWNDEEYETTLRSIEWSPSRTGLLNPVAVFDPVQIDGTIVSRASLHNFSIMRKLHIRINDKIAVYKANQIIPQVAKNLSDSKAYTDEDLNLIGRCPVCGSQGILKTSSDGIESVYCTNLQCKAKLLYRLEHFCSKEALDIEGLSESTLSKFIECGFLNEFADIFKLDRFESEIKNMEGFGETSFNNLIAAIKQASTTQMYRLLVGLGIPGIGVVQAKAISNKFNGDLQKFLKFKDFDYTCISGIGSILDSSIRSWMNDNSCQREVADLLNYVHISNITIQNTSLKLSGKTFVITGKLHKFKNRDQLVAVIEDNGGVVKSSITKDTNYLINNDINSQSSKNLKAKSLSIPVISEETFLEMI